MNKQTYGGAWLDFYFLHTMSLHFDVQYAVLLWSEHDVDLNELLRSVHEEACSCDDKS